MSEEERRVLDCVQKWLQIKAENQKYIDPHKYSLYQLSADVDHSDLLQRLLEGKEPYPPEEKGINVLRQDDKTS